MLNVRVTQADVERSHSPNMKLVHNEITEEAKPDTGKVTGESDTASAILPRQRVKKKVAGQAQ